MHSNRLTGLLFALLALGLIVGAALLSGAPQTSAAPLPILTQSAEPPTRTPLPPPSETPLPTSTAVPSETPITPPPGTPTTPPSGTPTTPPSGTPTPTTPDPDPTSTPPFADPAVAKTVDRPGVAVGELLRFTITVTSEGNVPAEGVIVEDTLPAYLEYVSASIERGQVVTSGPTVGFWIGQVRPGEVIRGEIVARVVSFPEGGTGTNVVVLRSESPTDRPENNRASTSFQVIQPAPEPPPADSPGGSPRDPTPTPAPGGEPTPTPAPGGEPALPPAGGEQPVVVPPASLPATAGRAGLPYGLILLVGVTYMGLGLYLWLRPRRRKQ
jgi:uncharacterized repeat protein (TIGR01451 family)